MSETLVNQMIDVQDTLVELAIQKEQALINNELESLQMIVRKESSLVTKANALEEKMRSEVDLTDYTLKPLKERLVKVLLDLKKQNERNTLLLNDSLAFVRGSLQLFQNDRSVYTKEAKSKAETLSIFDSRA